MLTTGVPQCELCSVVAVRLYSNRHREINNLTFNVTNVGCSGNNVIPPTDQFLHGSLGLYGAYSHVLYLFGGDGVGGGGRWEGGKEVLYKIFLMLQELVLILIQSNLNFT